jgi:hypothetical protein
MQQRPNGFISVCLFPAWQAQPLNYKYAAIIALADEAVMSTV